MSANRARAIFIELVADVPPEQWDGRLAELAGDDPELHAKVAGLLAAHLKADSFLEGPAAPIGGTVDVPPAPGEPGEPPPEPDGTEQPGLLLAGKYKLLEQIGEGGFGVVFMAEQQQPLRRKVALKVLKPGMDTRQVVARFEVERQALALMDHPNIAKVLDAGQTASGRPYFVMDLVRGVPITEYCDQGRLTPGERLGLFVDVCRAVQHAHQKGLIHRDLKPSNVLVTLHDGSPLVKVIDFGIAKALGQQLTDKTLFTGFAQMIGTPLYMSPEQAALSNVDVDTRSDIYSLGVLLYELLTGTTPFTKERLQRAGYDEMRRIIREEEPPRPSTRISTLGRAATTLSTQRKSDPKRLSQLFRGELDWIVMKALEKDRNRRYETASAFAADVQRYLADEPVQACPPSAMYRFRKFARRHKAGLSTAALVCAALVAGTAVSLWQAVRATRAEQRAQEELGQKKQQHARAEANFRRTLAAVDGLLLEVGEKDLAAEPHLEHVRRRLLEKALRFFAEFLQEKGDDPATRFEAGMAYRRVGDIRALLGQDQQADADYARGIALLEQLADDVPREPSYRQELALTLHRRALLLSLLARNREAEQANQQARDLQEALVAGDPNHPDYRLGLANSLRIWAKFLKGHRQYGEAVEAARRALDLLEVPAGVVAKGPGHSADLARTQLILADVLEEAGRPREAEEAYQKAVDLAADLVGRVGDGPDEPNAYGLLTKTHVMFSHFLWRSGRIRDAEETARKAVEAAKPLAAKYPNIPDYQGDLAAAYGNLGSLYFQTGRPRDAVEFQEEARKIDEKLAANYPAVPGYQSRLGTSLSNLAGTRLQLDEPEKARALLERAITQQEAALKIDRQRAYREFLCAHHGTLASVLAELGLPAAEKDRAYQRAVELVRELAHDFPDVASYQSQVGAVLSNWAVLLKKRGEFQQARRLVEEAVTFQKAALKDNDRNPTYLNYLGKHYDILAEVLRALKSPDLERTYGEMVPVRQRLAELFPKAAEHPSYLGKIKNDLGNILERRGELEEARRLFEEAVSHQQAALALKASDPRYRNFLGNHYTNLSLVLRRLGRFEEADKAFRAGLAVREELAAQFPNERLYQVQLGSAWLVLAHLRGDAAALGEAAKAFRRAGPWKNAAEPFPQTIRLSDDGEAFEFLLVAMLAWHLDFKEEAGAWYRKAVAWEEKNAAALPAPRLEGLRRVRTEAEELLGIKKD